MPGTLSFHDVGMCFRMYRERVDSLKEAVLGRFRHRNRYDEFWALRHATVEVAAGESVGLIGHNGSGKSTLLKIAAGVLKPTEGRVRVEGRMSPMIELAAGFDPDLTGRDNIFLNGALMGHSRKEMASKLDRIVEFSELGEFIDQPVKNYSSGMYARLGFAIAADVASGLPDEPFARVEIDALAPALRGADAFVTQGFGFPVSALLRFRGRLV